MTHLKEKEFIMNENIIKRNELLAEKVIKGLKSRNMTGFYAATKEEALAKALEIIPEGSSVRKHSKSGSIKASKAATGFSLGLYWSGGRYIVDSNWHL